MGKSVLDYERRVKEIYANDKTDPELYTAIYDLAYHIAVYKHMLNSKSAIHEVAHNLASDFYMKIAAGELEIVCWTRYIQLMLMTYRNKLYDSTRKCQIDIKDATTLEDFKDTLYTSSRFVMSKESSLEIEDYIEYLATFVIEQYDKVVRYRRGTREYCDIQSSVLCSMVYHRTILIDRRLEPERDYVEFLVRTLTKRLYNYADKTAGTHTSEVYTKDVVDQRPY